MNFSTLEFCAASTLDHHLLALGKHRESACPQRRLLTLTVHGLGFSPLLLMVFEENVTNYKQNAKHKQNFL